MKKREDLLNNSMNRNNNTRILKGKYAGLLKQAEDITQHLNSVLFAK